MMHEEIKQQVLELITPFLEREGMDLVELKVQRSRGFLGFEILADKPRGGITIDECAYLNKKINGILDDSKAFDQEFVVSVCSPGIDWPLKTEKDFLRVMDRKVRFLLSEKIEEKDEYIGTINAVNTDHVVVCDNTREVNIPLHQIKKAVQII